MSGYERADVRPRPLLVAALALSAVVGLVAWGVGALFGAFEQQALGLDGGGHVRRLDEPPPGPRLQAQPALELAEHRALEARRTTEYAWVDRSEGLVRVPVERAMELLLERGLPVGTDQPGARDAGGRGR